MNSFLLNCNKVFEITRDCHIQIEAYKIDTYADAIEKAAIVSFEIQKNFINPLCDKYNLSFFKHGDYDEGDYDWYFESLDLQIYASNAKDCFSFMSKEDCFHFLSLVEILEHLVGQSKFFSLFENYIPTI